MKERHNLLLSWRNYVFQLPFAQVLSLRAFYALKISLAILTCLFFGVSLASPAPIQTLQQAQLITQAGQSSVTLPHALKQDDFGSGGGLVKYRLTWQLPSTPDQPQAVYVSKMSLSGRLYVNGQLVGDCGNAPLEELRCLHQPQFFRIPVLMLRAGENTLDFEIFATERQMNGLSVVRVGEADAVYEQLYLWRQFLTVDLLVGLTWLSSLLGLLSLTVGLVLRKESVFLWFGLTSILNALASLNAVVVHPTINIDVYNWMVFTSRLVSVPLAFLTFLAIFERDSRRTVQLLLGYSLIVPVAIWLSDNNRTVAFSLYIPLVVSCPVMLFMALRWTWSSRQPIKALSTLMMLILFGAGVVDWLRLGGKASFDGIYYSSYSYSGMLVTIGLLLMSRLAAALVQSQKLSALLEQQVSERIAYEVTENIPVGTFTIITQPGRTRPRFAFLSRRFLQITGLSRDLLDRNFREALAIVHPDDRVLVAKLYTDAFNQKQPFSGRMRILVQGETRWITVESAPRLRTDGSTVWEGVVVDVTEQVRAQEEAERDRAALQEHLMAQTRLQEREQLLRDVHDGFGSQLASVRMMVEKGRIPPEKLPGYLQEVSADLHLVVDTLGQSEITLAEAIYDMRYRMSRRFEGSGIQFHWEIVLDALPPLSSRTILQILRIMQEATHNAIRHADARNITLTACYQKEVDRLVVSVRDDGRGMPKVLPPGRGIHNMQHRAREIGAHWAALPCLQGTLIELQLDHPDGPRSDKVHV
jgi:PAS domain S-box-containing protein